MEHVEMLFLNSRKLLLHFSLGKKQRQINMSQKDNISIRALADRIVKVSLQSSQCI